VDSQLAQNEHRGQGRVAWLLLGRAVIAAAPAARQLRPLPDAGSHPARRRGGCLSECERTARSARGMRPRVSPAARRSHQARRCYWTLRCAASLRKRLLPSVVPQAAEAQTGSTLLRMREERRTVSQTGSGSQRRPKPIDRHHPHSVLNMLDASGPGEAHDRQPAVSAPSPSATGQPCRLLARAREVPLVVASGFGFDQERDVRRGDRHAVDVPPTAPGERVPQPPSLAAKWRERSPHLVLRARPDSAAIGEPEPATCLSD
jgi:hypothetical protein